MVDVEYGSIISLIPAPEKEGYTFSGWSEIPETMPAEEVVIEGIFTTVTNINSVNIDTDSVVYNLNGNRVVDVENLERGIYIINGKKVYVK